MCAMQEVGIIPTKLALDKARKTRECSEMWASRGRHREYKQSMKALASLGNMASEFEGLFADNYFSDEKEAHYATRFTTAPVGNNVTPENTQDKKGEPKMAENRNEMNNAGRF